MGTLNINRAFRPRHTIDLLRIRRVVGAVCIGPMSVADVERLWETYSRDLKAQSGWVPVTDETLAGFGDWLRI
jgi:hypothetical protein